MSDYPIPNANTLRSTIAPVNRNLLWTKIVVEEWARCGLREVCIAPGSRSTPLVIAFAEQPGIRITSHIDERCAAFFALGLASASRRPVALVCSSGTATANFFPAIVEARYANIPLLVLTADRPPELRESGANQTVEQVKLYGGQVLWSVDVALPEATPPAYALRNLRTLACRAYAHADGIPKGAVHLNFPFRKPLEPIPVADDHAETAWNNRSVRPDEHPYTQITRGTNMPSERQIAAVASALVGQKKIMIVCGARTPGDETPSAIKRLAHHLDSPIFADPLSNMRFGDREGALIVGGYDSFLPGDTSWETPDVIVQIGAPPTSAALEIYLMRAENARRILLSADGVWLDAAHQIDLFVHADPAALCEALLARLPAASPGEWLSQWQAAEAETWRAIDTELSGAWFDGAVVAHTMNALPERANLFIANSLPVRHLDQFARPSNKNIRVFCNRGASGIDGTVSSALGVALAEPEIPLICIVGDLAFYHDLNGLLAVSRTDAHAVFVVVNNDGGGIFKRLPIADFDPPFTDLFLTPHGLHFEDAARLYGLDYHRADSAADFDASLRAGLRALGAGEKRSTIIEVPTDSVNDLEQRTRISANVSGAVRRAIAAGSL